MENCRSAGSTSQASNYHNNDAHCLAWFWIIHQKFSTPNILMWWMHLLDIFGEKFYWPLMFLSLQILGHLEATGPLPCNLHQSDRWAWAQFSRSGCWVCKHTDLTKVTYCRKVTITLNSLEDKSRTQAVISELFVAVSVAVDWKTDINIRGCESAW